jgi:prepilin-type N-terminal cleavage/methylation domain-containing protein
MMTHWHGQNHGFTLIEMSIVLVIIGLIIGGTLVGQDLVKTAGARATLAQIEKYNTSANTFKVKYGYIPGDIPDPYASQFGFQPRGTTEGEGDGNGVIEGIVPNGQSYYGVGEAGGETVMFWADLSAARMIDGGFSLASPTTEYNGGAIGTATFPSIFPAARIGNGSYILAYSNNGTNYFLIEAVTQIAHVPYINTTGQIAGLTPAQAYNIDKKIDDGLPTTGHVTAALVDAQYVIWSFNDFLGWGVSLWGSTASIFPPNDATPAVAGSCIDNGNVSGAMLQYSVSQNGSNCGVSFQMQGAAR